MTLHSEPIYKIKRAVSNSIKCAKGDFTLDSNFGSRIADIGVISEKDCELAVREALSNVSGVSFVRLEIGEDGSSYSFRIVYKYLGREYRTEVVING